MTFQKAEIIKKIKEQVSRVKTPYDLVRLNDIVIATNENKFIVAEMLLELNEFSNVVRKMNESQIVETVNMLLNQYPRLSIQEYQVFFNMIKAGKFGQLYESLDGIKIMAFMEEFYKDMVNSYNEFKEESHQQIKMQEQHRDL
jgi:hypothetical protein